MNSASTVDKKIDALIHSGIPLSEAAWEAAKACIGWPYIFGDRGEYDTPEKRQAVYNKHPEYKGLITGCQVLRETNRKDSCDGCKWYPGGCRVRSFDCRGFTYWILLQVYGWKLKGAGATSQWNTESNWSRKGSVADGIPDGVLVCLFVRNGSTMEHTGFGFNGETVECSVGVQYSKKINKKWTDWAIPKCVAGADPDPGPVPEPGKPTLRQGDSGPYVVEMQEALMARGYNIGSTGADGKFGKNTKSGLIAFQAQNGLTVDGICGSKTWAALAEPVSKIRYTVHIPHLMQAQADAMAKAYADAWMTEENEK